MKRISMIPVLLFISLGAQAAQVGVVDSGTYFGHDWLKNNVWIHAGEKPGNNVDDDRNGKVDDVVGWNFADNFWKVFYPEHISIFNPMIYRLFELIAKTELGTITQDEKDYWNKNVASLSTEKKAELIKHINAYGQYAHSTHCSGIVVRMNSKSLIMSARLLPDALPDPYDPKKFTPAPLRGVSSLFYKGIAALTNQMFYGAALYLNETKMDVANYSLGVAMSNIAKQYLALTGNKNPDAQTLAHEAKLAELEFTPHGIKWMASSPNTLFVVAAGNDNVDIEALPFFPASVNMENSITVAASQGISKLARFSNTGANSVHVAAPGVAILSSVPGPSTTQVIPLSGTSMAAPVVTGVASRIKDINSKLKPVEIKAILMGTVDVKEWLRGKVITSGIVNPIRAYQAAQYSKSATLQDAIAKARSDIADMQESPALHSTGVPPTIEMLDWARRIVF